MNDKVESENPNNYPAPPSLPDPTDMIQSTNSPNPQTQTVSTFAPNPFSPSEKPNTTKTVLLMIGIILIFVFSGSGLTYAAVYDKLKLPISAEAKRAISNAVMDLPFTPKTPSYVIEKALIAQQDIKSYGFDMSSTTQLQSTNNPLLSFIPFTIFEVVSKGSVNVLENDVLEASMTTSISNIASFELVSKDTSTFVSLTSLSETLLTPFGINPSAFDVFIGKWIDLSTYGPSAYTIDPTNDSQTNTKQDSKVTPEQWISLMTKISENTAFRRSQVTQSTLNGNGTYQLTISPTEAELTQLTTSFDNWLTEIGRVGPQEGTVGLSDVFENVSVTLNIKQDDFTIQKLQISGVYTGIEASLPTSSSTTFDKVQFVSTIDITPSKESTKIVAPLEFISYDEVIDMIADLWLNGALEQESAEDTNLQQGGFDIFEDLDTTIPVFQLSPSNTLDNAYDTQRAVNIFTITQALEMYNVDCSTYPNQLQDLVSSDNQCTQGSTYLSTVPHDPLTKESYFYQINSDKTYSLCMNMIDPSLYGTASTKPCPDPAYNTHIESE
jgi:Type II secretion system (T2SS), protein G